MQRHQPEIMEPGMTSLSDTKRTQVQAVSARLPEDVPSFQRVNQKLG